MPGLFYVRNDEATGWTRAKNANGILQQIRAHGKLIDSIDSQSHPAPAENRIEEASPEALARIDKLSK